jgi:hypothetical protein
MVVPLSSNGSIEGSVATVSVLANPAYQVRHVMTRRVTRFTCANGIWPWYSPHVAHIRVT